MSSMGEYPVTINGDGTGFVLISPYSTMFGVGVDNGQYLSFVTNGYGTGILNGAAKFPGLFTGQAANTVGYAIDTMNVHFLNT